MLLILTSISLGRNQASNESSLSLLETAAKNKKKQNVHHRKLILANDSHLYVCSSVCAPLFIVLRCFNEMDLIQKQSKKRVFYFLDFLAHLHSFDMVDKHSLQHLNAFFIWKKTHMSNLCSQIFDFIYNHFVLYIHLKMVFLPFDQQFVKFDFFFYFHLFAQKSAFFCLSYIIYHYRSLSTKKIFHFRFIVFSFFFSIVVVAGC